MKPAIFLILFVLWRPSYIYVFAAEIFLLDRDNGVPFYSIENGINEGCEKAIERALVSNGNNVTIGKALPDDLSTYDAVFIVLGFYCPG